MMQRNIWQDKKNRLSKSKKLKNLKLRRLCQSLEVVCRQKNKYILSYRTNQKILEYMNHDQASSYMNKGTITPDHVIRIKPFPLFMKMNDLISNQELKKI